MKKRKVEKVEVQGVYKVPWYVRLGFVTFGDWFHSLPSGGKRA